METPGYKSWGATLLTLALSGLSLFFLLSALGGNLSPPKLVPAFSGFLLFFIGALSGYFLPLDARQRYPMILAFFLLGNALILHAGGWFPCPWEVFFFGAAAFVYGAWIFRLVLNVRNPRLDFDRIADRYVLYTQLLGFVFPVIVAGVLTLSFKAVTLSLLSPFLILLPVSLFIGLILGRLRQGQLQLFQSKKRAALGGLLAGLAHEIKNPITFIYSNIDPLRDTAKHLKASLPNPDPKTAAILEDFGLLVDNLEEGAERVKGIVDNFRYFSYPGRGRREAVDVSAILDRSLELLRFKWKDRIQITRRYGELPKIEAEPGEIGQVFVNLLDNACDAITGRGEIAVSTERKGSNVEIRMKDSGSGIPKRILSKIFDPFYTSKPQGQGTGLGLAIAIQIVEDHKGRIEVKSDPGKGTEVVVLLPARGEG